jgi:hypothetical protein
VPLPCSRCTPSARTATRQRSRNTDAKDEFVRFNPPLETCNLAIVHAASFDAVNAIERRFHPYAVRLRAPQWASAEAAAIAAAHRTLAWWHRLQRHDVTEFTSSFCSLYDAASRGPVFCESDGAAVHRPPRQHSNESDMALDGRDIALIAVACDEIFFGRVATVIRPAASYQ